jgi:phosphoribosylamine--glycine ligase
LGVVLAAGGYPGDYRKGDVIVGLPGREEAGAKVFVAGARLHDGQAVTSGGRVLCACALGEDVAQAQRKAYELAADIHWPGVYYRKDIGYRAIQRA